MASAHRSYDVAVVGGGVMGLSITRALGQAGHSAVCVGHHYGTPGSASSAAGAMLGALGEVTASAVSEEDLAELRFRLAAATRYPAFLAELTERTGRPLAHGVGTVVVANLVNEEDRANLRAMAKAATDFGLRAEAIDPDDVPGLRPARGYEAIAAQFFVDEGWVDTDDLLAALAHAVRTGPRTRLLARTVRRVTHSGGAVTGAELDDGEIMTASTVVLAAGVGVQELLDELGEPLLTMPQLLSGKGVSVRVEDLQDVLPYVIRTPNRDFACGTHVVPRGDGSVYLGATNRISATPGSASGVTPGELHALLNSAMHEINTRFRTTTFVSARYGLRPLSSDHYPVVGATAMPGLAVATGTYRNGVLLAPLIADIITREITGSGPVPDNPFRPDAGFRRCGRRPERVAAAVEQGMRDLVSFILEPGGHLPYDRHRELRAFLQAMGRGALADGDVPEFRRMRELLERYPIAEIVPQLFYEVAADVDRSAE